MSIASDKEVHLPSPAVKIMPSKDAAKAVVNEAKTADGACYLELKVPSRPRRDGFWEILHRYGYHYGDGIAHPLLP
nr:DNA-directed RNA polymerase V subunit 1 [Tanacetum cinerariifolium]